MQNLSTANLDKSTSNELLVSLESKFGSKQAIIQKALSNDGDLLAFLLENDELKSRFFAQINAALVFKKDEFLDFLKLRILDASYTKFQNKIGLFADENFLKNSGEVVLNFAYKDCVLKGIQSKDNPLKSEEKDKNKEIMFNEILAKDEIDVLLLEKALCNFELVSQNGGGGRPQK